MENKEIDLLMAEQQLTGFLMGSEGKLTELLESMNLKKNEWEELKKQERVNFLSGRILDEIESYFKGSNLNK